MVALLMIPAFSKREATDEIVSPSFTVKFTAMPGSPDGFNTLAVHHPTHPSNNNEAETTIATVRVTPRS
jgi:hypothetical protein